MKIFCYATLLLLVPFVAFSSAGEADVVKVESLKGADGYYFNVTVLHSDEGWKHYANKWDVVSPDGQVLATRILYHPHVDEQPFTRSLSGVKIPEGVYRVTIRAHDLLHEYGGKTVTITLSQ